MINIFAELFRTASMTDMAHGPRRNPQHDAEPRPRLQAPERRIANPAPRD